MEEIERRLQSVMPKNPSPYGWGFSCNWLYSSIKTYEDIKNILSKPTPLRPPATCPCNEEEWKWREAWSKLGEDTNTRIILMRDIVADHLIDLLPQDKKKDLEKITKSHLNDTRMCDIGYSTSYADEEDTSTVSDSARYLLSRLKN